MSAGLLGAAPASGSPSRGREGSWLPVRRAWILFGLPLHPGYASCFLYGRGADLAWAHPAPLTYDRRQSARAWVRAPSAGVWASFPLCAGIGGPRGPSFGRGPFTACLPGGAPSSGLAPPRACGVGTPAHRLAPFGSASGPAFWEGAVVLRQPGGWLPRFDRHWLPGCPGVAVLGARAVVWGLFAGPQRISKQVFGSGGA